MTKKEKKNRGFGDKLKRCARPQFPTIYFLAVHIYLNQFKCPKFLSVIPADLSVMSWLVLTPSIQLSGYFNESFGSDEIDLYSEKDQNCILGKQLKMSVNE